jgi:predicted alpha/beta superfamily hydrolase
LLTSNALLAQSSIEYVSIDSKHINETRKVTVNLPKEYKNSTKKYPLLLVVDEELLFNTTSAIVNQLSNTSRMPECIVVSLSSGNKHRNHFAPNLYNNHRDRIYNYGNHQDEFIKFLELELFPTLEEKYRTAAFKMYIGFSPSSAIGLYTLLNKPNLFQAYICFAACNIIGDGYQKDERLIEELENLFAQKSIKQNYLYIVSGSKDAASQPYINTNIKDFNEKLNVFNSKTIHTKAETIEGEGHTDVILPGLIAAFEFIFPKEKWLVDYLDLIEKKGPAKVNIISFYENLSNEYGFEIYPNADRLYSMSCLKNIGRRLLGTKNIDEAVALYEYWTHLYPSSHLAHYYLGMSFDRKGNNRNAIKSFKKAYDLALLQKSDNAKMYLEAIEKLTK